MKLAPRTFQIYWDAHAWVGVVAALLLHVIFFMGAFALFDHELNHWANPGVAADVGGRAPPAPSRVALQPLWEQLQLEHSLLGKRRVSFEPEPNGWSAAWNERGQRREFLYSPASGRLEPKRSGLGSFLYEMHYLGPFPKGVYVAGVAALALLFALLTGLFLHWKDLRRQWFQFRAERVTRTWSSDMHKVLGVFGLPYQLVYAWTGAVLSLSFATVQPALVQSVFGGDERAARVARGDTVEAPEPTGRLSGTLPDLDVIMARAERELPGLKPTWIGVQQVGDERSSVSVWGDVPGLPFGSANVVLAADGSLIGVKPADAGPYARFEAWFFGLHYARFGGYGVKLLYALLAFGSCAVIVTGNLVWLERRDARRAHRGNRWLERLTAGWCSGLALATSALFLANRCLPGVLPVSAASEQLVFWCVWAIGIAAAWRGSARHAASLQLLASGAAFVAAALIDLASGGGHDPLRLGVDGALVCLAAACIASGVGLARPRAARTTGSPALAAPEPAQRQAPAE